MQNKSKIFSGFFTCAVSLTVLLTPAAFAEGPPVIPTPVAIEETPQAKIVTLSGQILDATSKSPLQGVYVRQENALNSTYTDKDGMFSLRLLRGFSPQVVFQAEGYENIALPFLSTNDQITLELQPLKEYVSELPQAHNDPVSERGVERIVNNQFSLLYQGRYSIFNQNAVNIQGIALNEWAIDTDLVPFYPLTFRGRFFRARTPVEVQGFPFQPAFYINHQQAKIGTGWTQSLGADADFYYGLDFILDNKSPNNRNPQDNQPVAFTGSNLDFEQNRVGAGLNALWAFDLNDRFTLMPEFTAYPVVLNFIDRPQDSVDYTVAGDIGAKLRFEIVPGAYAVARYYTQVWYGFGSNQFENNHFFQIGVSLDPGTLSKRLLTE